MHKKLIALILVCAMMLNLCVIAAADTVSLPRNLKEVAEELFTGDTSLDEVVVPYGTESIQSRAFANTTLACVYIPETVTYIAEDAFDGTVYPMIISPAGSYAQAYAEDNNIIWEDADTYYTEDRLRDTLASLENDIPAEPIVQPEYDLTPISTEGITDPEELERIATINQCLLELGEAQQAYNDALIALDSSWENGVEILDRLSINAEGDVITLHIDSVTCELSPETYDSLTAEWELVSVASVGGMTQYGISASGEALYLAFDNNSLSISETPSIHNVTLVEDLDAEEMNTVTASGMLLDEILDKIKDVQFNIQQFVNVISASLDVLIAIADSELASAIEAKDAANPSSWQYGRLVKNVEKAAAHRAPLVRIWSSINGIIAAISAWQDFSSLTAMNDILKCGHPYESEKEIQWMLDTAQEMNKYAGGARALYTADLVWNVIDVITSIAKIVSTIECLCPGPGWGALAVQWTAIFSAKVILRAAIKIIAKGAISVEASAAESIAKKLHAKLHGEVSGHVINAQTKRPLSNVTVYSSRMQTWTDQNGDFRIKLLNQVEEITFSKEGFEQVKQPLSMAGDNYVIAMDVPSVVSGYVTYAGTGKPAANIKVEVEGGTSSTLTDINGFYSVSAPTGNATVLFASGELSEKRVDIVVKPHMTNMCNAELKQFGVLRGKIADSKNGAPLGGVLVYASGKSTTTAQDGSYELILEVGTQSISFTLSGYYQIDTTYPVQAGSGNTLNLVMESSIQYGVLRGTVVDIESLAPLGGVLVRAGNESTTTAPDGSYELTLEAGTHIISFILSGYHQMNDTYVIQANSDNTLTVAMEQSLEQEQNTINWNNAYANICYYGYHEYSGYGFQTYFNHNMCHDANCDDTNAYGGPDPSRPVVEHNTPAELQAAIQKLQQTEGVKICHIRIELNEYLDPDNLPEFPESYCGIPVSSVGWQHYNCNCEKKWHVTYLDHAHEYHTLSDSPMADYTPPIKPI